MIRFILYGFLIGLAALGGLFARRLYVERQPISGTAQFYVGGHKLTVDRAMVRNADLRNGGAINRLDLVLQWPTMAGAASLIGIGEQKLLIFASLEDATARAKAPDDIDPSERPVELYARFLESEAAAGPGGLVQRRFRKATPYEGEQLYVSSPDERLFSARCPQEATPSDDLCLWQTRLDNIDLVVRFQPQYLVEWRHLSGAIRQMVPKLRGARK